MPKFLNLRVANPDMQTEPIIVRFLNQAGKSGGNLLRASISRILGRSFFSCIGTRAEGPLKNIDSNTILYSIWSFISGPSALVPVQRKKGKWYGTGVIALPICGGNAKHANFSLQSTRESVSCKSESWLESVGLGFESWIKSHHNFKKSLAYSDKLRDFRKKVNRLRDFWIRFVIFW